MEVVKLTMIVLLFPPRAFFSNIVSFESLYGTGKTKTNKHKVNYKLVIQKQKHFR